MTLAVDDRLYLPHMRSTVAARWADKWVENPIHWMMWLVTEKIPHFAGYIPIDVRRTWILPPTHRKEEWDILFAARVGQELHQWAIAERQPLVLLGSRVAKALLGNSNLSEIRMIDGVRYLTLPRPTDVAQYLENPTSAAKMRMACDEFFTEET